MLDRPVIESPTHMTSAARPGIIERWLRTTSIVCAPSAPIAAVLLDGTFAHLVLAGVSVGSGGAFLWRTRSVAVHGKGVVGAAIGLSLLWLAFVLSIVFGYERMMRNFN